MEPSTILVDYKNKNNYQVVGLSTKNDIVSFDFKNSDKESLKANLYLAKVLRIEHSLQAAFVDYGSGKAGFLPFAEIHPDYYQIPEFDKKKLQDEIIQEQLYNQSLNEHISGNEEEVDTFDVSKNYTFHKRYSIQEVIKKNQMVLVQVAKDERGVKGVSLTTYISLAGRYCVFMPNSANGIGVSRKINSTEERNKLLNAAKTCNIQKGMSLIVRTAGIGASEGDIRNDYRYLSSLWKDIKTKTFEATKIGLMHQESDILEQVIRDKYSTRTTNTVLINNKEGYDRILSYAKDLIPGDLRKIKIYKENIDMFASYKIYDKVSELLSPIVNLPSGGYIVINQTEALTAIDVNSSKSTSEKDIESTAIKTNLESAVEIANQVQLRNIGGLIVIDYIDMSDLGNKKEVERVTKNAFKDDKSRIQFTRLSQFGLMEISRQRLHQSLFEIATEQCSHCKGMGRVTNFTFTSKELLSKLEMLLIKNKYSSNHIEIYLDSSLKRFLIQDHKKDMDGICSRHGVFIHLIEANVEMPSYYFMKTSQKEHQIVNKKLKPLYYESVKKEKMSLLRKLLSITVK